MDSVYVVYINNPQQGDLMLGVFSNGKAAEDYALKLNREIDITVLVSEAPLDKPRYKFVGVTNDNP